MGEEAIGAGSDFPGGPAVKTPPCNGGDMALIPAQGTEIPHAIEERSPRATTREPTRRNY